ncbi:MAG: DJ-1/PfpI family protein [Solirubrobacteraceae bacterium]
MPHNAPVAPEALDALGAAHRSGARILSICIGAFVLGQAGLIDDRPVTTHWSYTDDLTRNFPRADVRPDRLYVDDGDVLTSAGLAAGLDLCIHLVRRELGAAAARDLARWNVIAPHRDGGQAQFTPSHTSRHPPPRRDPLDIWTRLSAQRSAVPLCAGSGHVPVGPRRSSASTRSSSARCGALAAARRDARSARKAGAPRAACQAAFGQAGISIRPRRDGGTSRTATFDHRMAGWSYRRRAELGGVRRLLRVVLPGEAAAGCEWCSLG